MTRDDIIRMAREAGAVLAMRKVIFRAAIAIGKAMLAPDARPNHSGDAP